MNRKSALIFAAILLGLAGPEAKAAGPDCVESVQTTLKERLAALREEFQLPLDAAFLQSDPRLSSFPALEFQMHIQWCPKIETVEAAEDFLAAIGFSRREVDDSFKRRIYLSDDPKLNADLRTREYQIGAEWNRKEFGQGDRDDPVLGSLYSAYGFARIDKGEAQSHHSVIFLGEYDGQGLVAVPYHGLTLARTDISPFSCEDFSYFFPNVKENPVVATSTLLVLPEADFALCAVDLKGKTVRLRPLKWDWSHNLARGTPLAVMGIGSAGGEIKLTYDNSPECQTLAGEEEATLFVNRGYPNSWRLPMGCDIMPGDSGAAVADRETGNWVGFVTTTTHFTFERLAPDLRSGRLPMERLLMESSHMVPLSKIKQALESKLSAERVSDRDSRLIRWLLRPIRDRSIE